MTLAATLTAVLSAVTPAGDVPPLDPLERAVLRGRDYLAGELAAAFDPEEPAYGFLPSVIGMALVSVGDRQSARGLEQQLFDEVEEIQREVAVIACMHLMAHYHTRNDDAYMQRDPQLTRWASRLIETQFLVQPTRRTGGILGGTGGKAVGSRRRARLRAEVRNPLSLAATASAFRGFERLGGWLDGERVVRPPGWRAGADEIRGLVKSSGVVGWKPSKPWPADLATTGGTLVLALALPAVSTDEADPGNLKWLERNLKTLDRCADWLDQRPAAGDGAGDWHRLALAVVRARLSWALDRPVAQATEFLLSLQRPDGGFDCQGDLPWGTDAEREFYQRDDVRRRLVTSLALLALTGCGRAGDSRRARDTCVARIGPQLGGIDPAHRGMFGRLILMDGLAARRACVDTLTGGIEELRELSLALLTGLVGWDFALAEARDAVDRAIAVRGFREWLTLEQAEFPEASSRSWRAIRASATAGCEDLGGLLALVRGEGRVGREAVLDGLRSDDAGVFRVTMDLLRRLGAPELEGLDTATPEAREGTLERLDHWLKRKLGG